MKTKKALALALLFAMIAIGLAACIDTAGDTMESESGKAIIEQAQTTEYIAPPYDIDSQKKIFLNPDIDANARIEAFVSAVFRDPKIVFFDESSFADMSEELNRYIFMVGVYRGIVYRCPSAIGEGMTKEMIEANIQAVFGADALPKLDYSYICADYDEKRGIYLPWVYGAPTNGLRYIFHSIENVRGNVYRALVSYIDANGFLLSFAADGSGEWIIPKDINDRIEKEAAKADWEEYSAIREKGIEEFMQEIRHNPEKYERTELYFEIGGDYIHLLSAKLYA